MKLGLVLFIASIGISFVLLSPSVKQKTIELMLDPDKKVLSQVEMEHNGTRYKIVKVQKLRGLGVELYKFINDELVFLDSQNLTDKKDAFYKFDEGKHNLFLKDLNQDGNVEIILPSLDKNMKARLNVFHFNQLEERLVKISKH